MPEELDEAIDFFQEAGLDFCKESKLADPYHRLAVAIVWQVVCDTSPKDRNRNGAIHWILNPQKSDWLLEYLEVAELARQWARKGCPRPARGKIPRRNKVSDRDWSKYNHNVFDEM